MPAHHGHEVPSSSRLARLLGGIAALALAITAAWSGAQDAPTPTNGKHVFRFDSFGNETFWTDTLRLHEAIAKSVDPTTALSVGLKVDADALPPGILKTADLKSPATTVALLKLDAIVGLKGTVVTKDGKDTLMRVGITCALCHSTVDDSVAPGIGKRLDGRPNLTSIPGAIIALSPALDASKKAVYNSWGAGKYDPRYNQDGKNMPRRHPARLRPGTASSMATYTGDGDISYWNNYVAVTQMGGHGSFKEPRLGINVEAKGEDLVKSKLPALREYQHSLAKPAPAAGSFDATAAQRGQVVFAGAGRCATCHAGRPSRTRSCTRRRRRAWIRPTRPGRRDEEISGDAAARCGQHAPYFHDGTAASLAAVVDHYDSALKLKLSADQKKDLVEYLKSI